MAKYVLSSTRQLRPGEKIPAIKALRSAFTPTMSLSSAKEVIDQVMYGDASLAFESGCAVAGQNDLCEYGLRLLDSVECEDPILTDLAGRITRMLQAGEFKKAAKACMLAHQMQQIL